MTLQIITTFEVRWTETGRSWPYPELQRSRSFKLEDDARWYASSLRVDGKRVRNVGIWTVTSRGPHV